MGHSLGGLVAALAAARAPVPWSGLILLSPAIDVELTCDLWCQSLFAGCLNCLVPSFRIVAAVRDEDLSKEPAVVAAWKANPLNIPGPLTIRISYAGLLAFEELKKLPPCSVPLLVIHGLADKCTSFKASEAFVARAQAKDKKFVGLPNVRHMLFHEPEKEKAISEVEAWILARGATTTKYT